MGIREKYRQTGDCICTGDGFRRDQEVRCTQKGRVAFQEYGYVSRYYCDGGDYDRRSHGI